MFKNYLKTAWRSLKNNKAYSAINIFGLAAGMAITILIGLWVYHQYSYNKFLPENERIYRVGRHFNSNGEFLTFFTTSLKLTETLRAQVPDIEYIAESDWMGPHGLMVGEVKLFRAGGQVGGDFLQLFEYPLLRGTAKSALQDPYSIVLTESLAKALFGNADPINKTVRFDNRDNLKVTGILRDLPANSTLGFKYLVPFSYVEQVNPNVKVDRTGSFGGNSYQQFVRLRPGATLAKVNALIKDIEKTETTSYNAMQSDVFLHPLKDWHLYGDFKNGVATGGLIEYVRMFGIIGILVLAIACINFVNLTTARSEKRAREVGVRKAIGSLRRDLVIQFLLESFLLTLIAGLLALLLVQLVLPAFNLLTGTELQIPFQQPMFWLVLMGAILLTALVAGSRPAFYLSSFNPVKVLKGTLNTGRVASWPRKTLVVLQFSCSIALIISTIVIYQQINHARNRPTGYSPNRLMMTDMNIDLNRNYTAMSNELKQKGLVEQITTATSPATNIYWHTNVDEWPGKNPGETVEMGMIVTGQDYFKTLGIQMKEGRDFVGPADTLNVIINETAAKRLRLKEPVNQIITMFDLQIRIIGVTKDALMLSPFGPADPTMFAYSPNPQPVLMYRLSKNVSTKDALAGLTEVFNRYNPSFPYSYQFVDEEYAGKFSMEVLIGKLAGLFAALAILISCLGLFGLAAYMAEVRTKEIGIRKVLGASVTQVWTLLTKDFILLVLVSCLIACPLALYFLQNWLQKYDYRITIGPWVFIIAAAAAIVITILTISFQAIRSATANPVKSLRTE